MSGMISDDLDALQARFPACGTLAYADVSTGTVLVTNSATPLERHGLNQIGAEAALLFRADGEPLLGMAPARLALVSTQDAIRIFLRSDSEPNDGLLCVGEPGLDLARFLPEARACLARIGEQD
ncbi:hypothetical protein [Albidovulum sp.]